MSVLQHVLRLVIQKVPDVYYNLYYELYYTEYLTSPGQDGMLILGFLDLTNLISNGPGVFSYIT